MTPNKATLYLGEQSKRKLMLDDLRLSLVMQSFEAVMGNAYDCSIIWVAVESIRRFLATEQLEGPHDLAKLSK